MNSSEASAVFLVDGEPFPLIGGEIHFWRHDPAHWPALLDTARALSLTFVGTYICWQFHEVEEGMYDLSVTKMRALTQTSLEA